MMMTDRTGASGSMLTEAQQRNAELHQRLEDVQRQRKDVQQQQMARAGEQERLHAELELARSQQQHWVDNLRSMDLCIETLQLQLDRAQSWNVLASDAYHVHQEIAVAADGSTTTSSSLTKVIMIGTMNGLRLAAPTYASSSWKEVNSAFGYVALLLSQLERQVSMVVNGNHSSNSNHRCCNLRYVVHAAGGNSKIGLRNGSSSSLANLYFAEDSFQFFSRRNFNTALGYLLGHVQDLTRCLQELDQQQGRTIVLSPFAIDEQAKTVAGVSIVWVDEATSATDFTRALRYLLTNLKHLMGYPAIGLVQWGGQRVAGPC